MSFSGQVFNCFTLLRSWLQFSGFGNILSLDEFFLYPLHQHNGTCRSETLTYFLEDHVKDDEVMDFREENKLSRHGIQVCFQTCMAGTDTMKNVPHVIEMSNVNKLFLESGNGKGGAEVRVITGNFEQICSSTSFQECVRPCLFNRTLL